MQIYGLEVVVIPTHRPMIRKDNSDFVYLHAEGQVRGDHRGHPRLRRARAAGAGRHDLDRDLGVARPDCCSKEGIAHEVLNAKQHEREAHIVAAGRAARARSPSPPTWPAAAPTSCSAATSRRSSPRAGASSDEAAREAAARRLAGAARPGARRRRPAHRRHRAARVAPHRQPAARPLRPPGRSGLEPLLPVAGRQSDAHLRRPDAHASGC